MHTRIYPIGIMLLLMLVLLALSACVRPYPGSEASAAQPTPIAISTQPVVLPQQPITTPTGELVTAEAPAAQEPTPVAVEPTAEPQTEQIHIVVTGETLFKIATQYGVTVDEIAAANNIINVNVLEVGQELLIPVPGATVAPEVSEPEDNQDESSAGTEESSQPSPTEAPAAGGGVHVVQPGENLFRIGLRYGCSVEQLARYNGITTPNRISVGQQLQIPDCN